MEEQKKTNFIDVGAEKKSDPSNIFQELSSDLDLDYTEGEPAEKAKRPPLVIASSIMGSITSFIFLMACLVGVDATIRGLNFSDWFTNAPPVVCSYLSFGVLNYENTRCETPYSIAASLEKTTNDTEKNLAANLLVLMPKRLKFQSVANSPEVQFIKQNTGKNRVSILDMIAAIDNARVTSPLRGEDIECRSYTLDEKGNIDMSCDFYGGSLNGSSVESNTSREVTIGFLRAITDGVKGIKSPFQVMNYPNTLSMDKYSSPDVGIKSQFSTKTTLNLKLRYLSSNQY